MTEQSPSRPLYRRRSFWAVAVVWVCLAAGLRSVWPVEPRLTFRGDAEVLGISHDNRTLVALTRRATEFSKEKETYSHQPSGPVQIWDLKTGRHDQVCLPEQSCTGELVECDDGQWRMREPDGWSVVSERLLRGTSVILSMKSIAEPGMRWQDLLFDSKTKTFRPLDQGVHPKMVSRMSGIELSPGGRWYSQALRPFFKSEPRHVIREAATGKDKLAFDVDGVIISSCYSRDDSHFACAIAPMGIDKTNVWKVETGELVCAIDRALWGLAFSEDGRLLAGFDKYPQDGQTSDVLVYDVRTGDVVKQWNPGVPDHFPVGIEALSFVDHDKWLVCYQPEIVNAGSMCQTSARVAARWNLQTGEVKTDLADNDEPGAKRRPKQGFVVPNAGSSFTDSVHDLSPLQFGIGSEGLCEIPTVHTLLPIPVDGQPLLLSRDGRTLVYEQYRMNSLGNLMTRYSIPIPGFLQQMATTETISWMVVDVPSGQTIAILPAQYYSFWLSPDQKTLVTIAADPNAVGAETRINVWDFPPRRPIIKPVAWSLIFPGLCLVWCGFRRWRTRARTPA